MTHEEIDYKLAAEQLRTGQPLFGKGGALAPMLERILNAALEGEMDAHLSVESRESGNRRNGKMSKTVQTEMAVLNLKQCESVRQYWPKAWRTRLSACTPLARAPEKLADTLNVSSTLHCLLRLSVR